MNVSTSEGSSRCQSGWTMYLDESVNSEDEKCHKGEYNEICSYVSEKEEEDDDDDDDLSMVSDASSGPRQKFDEDEEHKNAYFYHPQAMKTRSKTQSNKEKRCNDVDDTASSPFFIKEKSGLMKKTTSVAEKCASGGIKKGSDFSAQGSRELGSARKIIRNRDLH